MSTISTILPLAAVVSGLALGQPAWAEDGGDSQEMVAAAVLAQDPFQGHAQAASGLTPEAAAQAAAQAAAPAPVMVQPAPKSELACLALNVYHEARGEPHEGQVAVAAVTLNRLKSGRFGKSLCEVVTQTSALPDKPRACQFSWWCDEHSDAPRDEAAWARALLVAMTALYAETEEDPTRGALYFHVATINPNWGPRLEQTRRIGAHVFYAPRAETGPATAQRRAPGKASGQPQG